MPTPIWFEFEVDNIELNINKINNYFLTIGI